MFTNGVFSSQPTSAMKIVRFGPAAAVFSTLISVLGHFFDFNFGFGVVKTFRSFLIGYKKSGWLTGSFDTNSIQVRRMHVKRKTIKLTHIYNRA